MSERKEQVIWMSPIYYSIGDECWEELWKQYCEDNEVPMDEMTDDQKYEELNYYIDSNWEDERGNLDLELDGNIFVIADLGRWNGRFSSSTIINSHNLKEILASVDTDDYVKRWFDGYNILGSDAHHDATTYLEFREIRANRNIENLKHALYHANKVSDVPRSMINYYTKSLAPYVCDVYGWKYRGRKRKTKIC